MGAKAKDRASRSNVKTNGPSRPHGLGGLPPSVLAGLLVCAVCLIVLVVHLPAVSARALSFDDNSYMTENPLVQKPSWNSAWTFLREVWSPSTVAGYYQPLSMISLMLDYSAGGRPYNLAPFHKTSLALHMMNTGLIIVLLYLLFGKPMPAAIVGLIFGVHPMTVEPIPWVGERKTLLAAFFALWCLIFYVRYARKSGWTWYTACLVAYVLALMSKPTSTPLPMVLLLLDYWPLGRLSRKTIVEKLPFFAIGAFSAMVTYISQKNVGGVIGPGDYSWTRAPLLVCHNIIFYLSKMIWPVDLTSHYPYPTPFSLSSPMILAGVIGTAVLIVFVLISLRWSRAFATGGLIFFLVLLPTIQIVGFSPVIASDKFAYLPSVGLLMVLAWGIAKIQGVKAKRALVAVAGVIVILECVGTRSYLKVWQTTETLNRRLLALSPRGAVVHYKVGTDLYRSGEVDGGIEHLREAIRLDPNHYLAYLNLGSALEMKGDPNAAIACYQEVIRRDPKCFPGYSNLATTLASQGKVDESIRCLQQAIRLKPDFVIARFNLAVAYDMKGQLEEAIREYREVLKLDPNHRGAREGLAADEEEVRRRQADR